MKWLTFGLVYVVWFGVLDWIVIDPHQAKTRAGWLAPLIIN